MLNVMTLNDTYFQQYRSLMLQAYQNDADAFTSTPAERELLPDAWWKNRLSSDDGLFLTVGAVDEDELVGVVGIEFTDRTKTRHKARLVGMYIRPAYRGKGLGKKLLDVVIRKARERAVVQVLLLTVTQGNTDAVKLYQSAGFKSFGSEPKAIYSSGKFYSKEHMWLDIGVHT